MVWDAKQILFYMNCFAVQQL